MSQENVEIVRRSYEAFNRRDLPLIRATAAELPKVQLHDALAILPVIAEKDPANYDRAACRWLARFALERQVGLEEIREALAALEQLPDHPPARWVLGDLLA